MITFTATVTDTSGAPTTPTGTVTWSDGGKGGSFSNGSQCTLSAVGSSSSTCSTTYTPPSTNGPVQITATYPGDSTHAASSGSSALTVSGGTTPPALDGSGQCHAPAAGSSCTITISTVSPNDVCITAATYYFTDTPNAPSDTGGHTFTLRLSHTSGHILTKEYYFVASAALTNDAITFQDTSVDNVSATVLCVSGANTSSPFDSNAGLPAFQDQPTGTAVTFSTSHANDFLIVIGTDANAIHTISANAGWTLAQEVNAGSPDYPFDLGTEYQIVSSAQSGTSVYFDQFYSITNSRVNIADAIAGA
jgi:hypothetical protein